jgi:hypothetical protein
VCFEVWVGVWNEGDQRSQTGTWEAGNVAMAGVGRADGEEG